MAEPATLVWDGGSLVWDGGSLIWDQYVPPPDTLGDLLMVKDDRARDLAAKADRARVLYAKEDRARVVMVKLGIRRP